MRKAVRDAAFDVLLFAAPRQAACCLAHERSALPADASTPAGHVPADELHERPCRIVQLREPGASRSVAFFVRSDDDGRAALRECAQRGVDVVDVKYERRCFRPPYGAENFSEAISRDELEFQTRLLRAVPEARVAVLEPKSVVSDASPRKRPSVERKGGGKIVHDEPYAEKPHSVRSA